MHGILIALSILSAPGGVASVPPAPVAHDRNQSPTSPPPAAPQDPHYASKIMIADAAGWGVLVSGLALHSQELAFAGVVSLALAAPAVHMTRRQGVRALGSFGLRVGGTLLGGVLGVLASSPPAETATNPDAGVPSAIGGFLAGATIGLLAAEMIDIAVLAGGTRKRAAARPTDGAPALTIAPVIAPRPGGGLLGVAALF